MRYYELEETEPVKVPDYVQELIIKDYIEKRYTAVLVLSSFIIGFLLGVLAYAL